MKTRKEPEAEAASRDSSYQPLQDTESDLPPGWESRKDEGSGQRPEPHVIDVCLKSDVPMRCFACDILDRVMAATMSTSDMPCVEGQPERQQQCKASAAIAPSIQSITRRSSYGEKFISKSLEAFTAIL